MTTTNNELTNRKPAPAVVLVTGGTGYLAGWTITRLLEAGYTVRTTVRSLKDEQKLRSRLSPYTDGLERLTLHKADLLDDVGWAEALNNVGYVLHMASPMSGKEMITAAREGTIRILKASAAAGVKRVVLTSSGFAVSRPSRNALLPGQSIDERYWTDVNQAGVGDYMRAKTLAEQDAWAFVRSSGVTLELVTVLPGFILGPALNGMYSDSVGLIASMLKGRMPALPHIGFGIVDTRDLVSLHLIAMSSPEAAGERFLASGDFLWFREIATVLKEHFGARASKVSRRRMPDGLVKLMGMFNAQVAGMVPELGNPSKLSSEKAYRMLGWTTRAANASVIAAGESLLADQKREPSGT